MCLGPQVFLSPFSLILTRRTAKVAKKGNWDRQKDSVKEASTHSIRFTMRLGNSHF